MRLTWSAFLMLLLLAAPLAAQRRDTVTTRTDSGSLRLVTLSPVIVTGTLFPAPAERLGMAISTVSPRDLQVEPVVFAVEALSRLPGTFIDEANGPGGPTIIRLRGGEEVFTQILMDGVQINQAGGFFDFQGVTLTNVERVEVARGPQSALYGSSAVSGVVHFITARGQPGRTRLTAAAEGGAATEHGGSGHATLSLMGGSRRLQYSLGTGGTYYRGYYRLPHDTWTRDAVLRVDAEPGSRWSLGGLVRYIGVESKLPVRDPGATRVPLDPNARNERDRLAASATAEFRHAAGMLHRLTTSIYRCDFVYQDEFDDVASGGMYPFFVPDFSFTFKSVVRRATAEYLGVYQVTPRAGRWDLRFTYGGRGENEKLTDRTAGQFGDGELTFDRYSGALFAEAHATAFERVSVLLGTRLEKAEQLPSELTPRFTVVADLIPRTLALRLAAGRAYKTPNLQQQYLDNPFIVSNPNLAPETSTSWEAGVDVRSSDRRLALAATYFRQRYDNLIRTVQLDATRQINRNLGASRAQGVEVDARYAPGSRWLAGVSGSWTHTEILDNSGLAASEYPIGEALPFRPTFLGTAFVEVAPTRRVTGLVRARYIGTQTVLTERFSGARADLDPYVLAGATLSVTLTDGMTIYGRVDNLLNSRYDTGFDRPGGPLNIALGARLTN